MGLEKGNISVFVPHVGCPCRCSFCQQNTISGAVFAPCAQDVTNALLTAKEKKGAENLELAFFGGSFTAIERNYMESLLQAAQPFIGNLIDGIRISTRPDCIDKEILTLLKKYHVTSIELGCQSMCDDVLKKNNRGHTATDAKRAVKLIDEFGFSPGLQMMTGLYGSTEEKDIFTAKEIISLKPKTVRIYPTITLMDTPLADLYNAGLYIPPTLKETIDLCSKLWEMFTDENIKIIKLGLHSSQELTEKRVAGPYHPAFGELVGNKIMLNKTLKLLKNKEGENHTIAIKKGEISKFLGHKRENMLYLEELGYRITLIEDETIEAFSPTLKF